MARTVHIHRTAPLTTQEVREDNISSPYIFVQKLIGILAGILLALLAFRFFLALLGANSGNWFAHFIYTASYPFVAPFFGLFSYNYAYGVSRVEVYTLVAMVVYAVIAWILTEIVGLGRAD